MKSFKENYIDDVEEMNSILSGLIVEKKDMYTTFREGRFFIDYKNIKLKLYARPYGYALPELFIFNMDGSKASKNKASGMKAFRELQKMSHKFINDLGTNEFKGIYWNEWNAEKGRPVWSVGYERALLEFNDKYNYCEITNCISYDINSSYAFAMLRDMPDTSKSPRVAERFKFLKLQANEIGFKQFDGRLIVTDIKGDICKFAFPRVESPFKKFVAKFYEAKKNAKDKEERQQFKDILNFAVGYILRKNPFIHSAILGYARQYIERLKDENTLYINTDSIVSLKRREDIEKLLGDDVGQFKIDHQGTFRRVNGAYQWQGDKPKARGYSKEWFNDNFNILTDDMPTQEANKYILIKDNKRFKIVLKDEVKNYED